MVNDKPVEKTDPFLEMIKNKESEKKKKFTDALLFGKSEAHTDSGRRFVKSCQQWFDEKGYLTQRQVDALYKVDSEPRYHNSYVDEEYYESQGHYPDEDYDFDPFDP